MCGLKRNGYVQLENLRQVVAPEFFRLSGDA
jgi:hypothetical protein